MPELDDVHASMVDALCEKAQEAFVLGIELFNRPTLRYRLESCAYLLCNAWELLLKAYLMKRDGPDSIYYSDKRDRTLSLEDCVRRVFTNEHDPLRKGLEQIIKLRNTSTHFIVDEYEVLYGPLLQACVENFDEKARELMGMEVSDLIPQNYLALSVRRSPIDLEECRARYTPEVLDRLITARSHVLAGITDDSDNTRYAHVYVTELRSVKRGGDLTFSVSRDAAAEVAMVTRVVNPADKYPYRTKGVVERVNSALSRRGIALMMNGEPKGKFTRNDFQNFIRLYSMKEDERYSMNTSMEGEQAWYSYSQQAIDDIVEILAGDPEHALDAVKEKAQGKRGKEQALDD